MSLIDDLYTNLNNITFTNKIIISFSAENRKICALKKIKKKYGSLLFDKYECLIDNLSDIILENNISKNELKNDIDFLFCRCQDNLIKNNTNKSYRRSSTSVIGNNSINNKIASPRRNSTDIIKPNSSDNINNLVKQDSWMK